MTTRPYPEQLATGTPEDGYVIKFVGGEIIWGEESGGGGGGETLEQTLVLGNTTGANWILVENGYGINSAVDGDSVRLQAGGSTSGSMLVSCGSNPAGNGGTLTMESGDSTSGGNGGTINILSGTSDDLGLGGYGGPINITTGIGDVNGGEIRIATGNGGMDGGSLYINGGIGAAGGGGNITLAGGQGALGGGLNMTAGDGVSNDGGQAYLGAGDSTNANGGGVYITAGSGSTGGGYAQLIAGDGLVAGDVTISAGLGDDGDYGDVLVRGNSINFDTIGTGTEFKFNDGYFSILGDREVRWYGGDGHYSGIKASTTGTTNIWTLPEDDGTSGTVLTTDGSGFLYWSSVGGGDLIEVDDLADLALVASSGLVWVRSLKCLWHKEDSSSVIIDNITIIDALGDGYWERLIPTTALDWLYQNVWYVDQAIGDDEADGYSDSPVQSITEINRRLSVGEIHQDVTIHIQNGYFDEAWLDIDAGGRGHKVTIIGHDLTTLATDASSTWSNYSHVTPAPNLLTGTAIVDWSSYLATYDGIRIRNAAGPEENVSWVYFEDPVGTAWVGNFPLWVGDPPVTGVVGANFIVESVDAGFGRLKLKSRDSTANFEVVDVFIGEIVAENCPVVLSRCFLYESDYPGEVFIRASSSSASIIAYSCGMTGRIYPIGRVSMEECTSFNAQIKLASSSTANFYRCTFNGSNAIVSVNEDDTVYYYAREGSRASAYINDCQVWGGQSCITLGGSCDIKVQSGELSGYATSGYGLIVNSDMCSFTWNEDSGWLDPNLGGSSGQIVVNLDSLLVYAVWNTVNIRNLEQRGTGTLVGGQVTINARGANYWGVFVSRNTRDGVAGELFVPAAQRTSANFRVDSLDSAGALVVTDIGTFDWYIPGPAVNIIVGRELYGPSGLSVLS